MSKPFETLCALPLLAEDLRGYPRIDWIKDVRLQRNVVQILEKVPRISEVELIRLLFSGLKSNPSDVLTNRHLIAWTSRSASSVVFRIKSDLENLKRIRDDSTTFYKDLYQLAIEETLRPAEFYKSFDPDRAQSEYWLATLKNYVKRRMEGLLCDKIRTMEGMKTYKRSDLGLASRSTGKQTLEALQFIGLGEPERSQYLLVWKSFQEVRGQSQESKLQSETFIKTAARYNHLRLNLPFSPEQSSDLDAATVEVWLKQMGVAIRRYLDRASESLDDDVSYQNGEGSVSKLEQLVDTVTTQEGRLLILGEIQSETQEVKQFLEQKLDEQQPERDQILLLKHGLKLGQEQLGIEINKTQSTVSRNYKKQVALLLGELGRWAINQQGESLDSETLTMMKVYLIEQLDEYYFALIDIYYVNYFNTLERSVQEMLRLHYLKGLEAPIIAQNLEVSIDQRLETLPASAQLLTEGVSKLIENRIEHTFVLQGPGQVQLAVLTEAWLKIAPYTPSV
jgi:hypothetical protein